MEVSVFVRSITSLNQYMVPACSFPEQHIKEINKGPIDPYSQHVACCQPTAYKLEVTRTKTAILVYRKIVFIWEYLYYLVEYNGVTFQKNVPLNHPLISILLSFSHIHISFIC